MWLLLIGPFRFIVLLFVGEVLTGAHFLAGAGLGSFILLLRVFGTIGCVFICAPPPPARYDEVKLAFSY